MNSVRRLLFLKQIKNVKWARNLSKNAMLVDDYTLRSVLPHVEPSSMRVLDRMWLNSSIFKDKVALISAETNKTYTYSQVQKFMGVFATSLIKKLGLQPNDMLAIAMPNCVEYPVVAFGGIQAGCIVTTINPAYKNYELVHHLKVTKPKAVVTIPEAYKSILQALKDAEVYAKIVFVDNPNDSVPDGVIRYSEIAESGEIDYQVLDKVERSHDDLAFLPFSSGTTGLPKGVQITHRNLLASLDIMWHEKFCMPSLPDVHHQDALTCILPFFHIYGLVVLLLGHLSLGCKLFTMGSFRPDVYLDIMKQQKITLLYGVPPLLTFLGKAPIVTKDYFEHLKFIFCAAAPLSTTDAEAMVEKLSLNTQFIQGYALTETTSMGVITYIGDKESTLGSCGDPALNIELRFADPASDSLVPVGQPGEVLIRGPSITSGYYQNEKATKESFAADGFFKTGDLGVYKPGEGLYILDRLKELIKVKGMQVAPAELEGLLRAHPSVIDAGVVGIPHPDFGEVPKAFVVLDDDKPVTEEDLKAFVAENVISYKKIHEVVFIDAIPKNPSGKILRRELKNV